MDYWCCLAATADRVGRNDRPLRAWGYIRARIIAANTVASIAMPNPKLPLRVIAVSK